MANVLIQETAALAQWANEQLGKADFTAMQSLVRRLGAHYDRAKDVTEFGFWLPDLHEQGVTDVWLELLSTDVLEFKSAEQTVTFEKERFELTLNGEFGWCVLKGAKAGSKHVHGDFYQVVYKDASGRNTLQDDLAYSLPYGVFAPAELYDMKGMFEGRRDKAYYENLELDNGRVPPPVNILQIHTATATERKSLHGLTQVYEAVANKLRRSEAVSPAEQNFIGYDAIQLMPIEPTIEYEGKRMFWQVQTEAEDTVTLKLKRPDMTNWGYDIIIAGSAAVSAHLLETSRPHELLTFIETVHLFPEPIKVIFDIVYGHADNQALGRLSKFYLAGAGMYGQTIAFRQPVARAIMLEMQRRKANYGADGLRIDGAQDFKYWDEESKQLLYDDEYLALMNDTVQDVAGRRYLPYMIFEDGRPWPRDDWELASSYREVTKQLPNVHQWGPLTFAHNTPFLFTFWLSKWWRIREIAELGSHWITGCANHDTLRRGTQVPTDKPINTYLGDSLAAILQKAYDNPAAKLFDYGFMPGVPMDFLNASMRAPWGFIRNTDERYGVKVVSEEARFLDWAVPEAQYKPEEQFRRLKKQGFGNLTDLKRFATLLDHAVQAAGDDLLLVAQMLTAAGFEQTPERLKKVARAWMDDVNDYVNVSRYWSKQDESQTSFKLGLRAFRKKRSWLMDNLGQGDDLEYRHPSEGTALFYGLRSSPDKSEQLLFVANMEGAEARVVLSELYPEVDLANWQLELATPGLELNSTLEELSLKDSEGLLLRKTA